MDDYEAMTRQADAAHDAGTEIDGLTPVRARVGNNVRAVFSLRLSAAELAEISGAAKARGQDVGEFIRAAAKAASRGQLDLSGSEQLERLQAMRDNIDELSVAIEQMKRAASSQPS